IDLVRLVRQARIQVVQAGTFGPQFYGLADDATVDRRWVGMPLTGVRENLTMVKELIADIQAEGAQFIGQMSISWHYGDHETGKGLFGAWDSIWQDDLLGPAPIADPISAQERLVDGEVRCWPIEGRPYRAYSGCLSNPDWTAVLKPMVKHAIDLGVDGLMVHHNFTTYCGCDHCRSELIRNYESTFKSEALKQLFGSDRLEGVEDLLTPIDEQNPEPSASLIDAKQRWEHRRRKLVFDEVFSSYGRSLKPDLKIGQWYHKYDFGPVDERSRLPDDLWAKDEDYLWYSQGGNKGISRISHGYLADMGMPARFAYAAGSGRPFVINKYDYKRYRLSIAEAAANHAAAPAFHWGPQEEEDYILDEYTGPLIRYHRFLADHDRLIRGSVPYSQAAVVYPRRAETTGDISDFSTLKRIGRLLEDDHIPFEMIIDRDLIDRAHHFELVILAGLRYLTRDEVDHIRAYVFAGGKLLIAGNCAMADPVLAEMAADLPRDNDPPTFADLCRLPEPGSWCKSTIYGRGVVVSIPEGPWVPDTIDVGHGIILPCYPLPKNDLFGHEFHRELNVLLNPPIVTTSAPWWVRMRAWRTSLENETIVFHWVNYRQDEKSDCEVPIPVEPFDVTVAIPSSYELEYVEWCYPEMGASVRLSVDVRDGRATFRVPGLVVYGLSVLYIVGGESAMESEDKEEVVL
ncbi:MAG: hypothetical protein HOH43_05665, partial [Candidatus Latescibacteria bacterium]|nr:hypothetical protein [Candidatus Latescibacterota bacterium]